jgi:hypothetical protein
MSEHSTEYACQGYHPMDAWVRYGPIFTEKAGAEEERRNLCQQFPDTNFRVVSRPLPKWMPLVSALQCIRQDCSTEPCWIAVVGYNQYEGYEHAYACDEHLPPNATGAKRLRQKSDHGA